MRSTLDKIFAAIGLAIALVLAVGAGLLFWASSFVGQEVASQLGEQNITMPTDQTGLAKLPQADQDALRLYAGTPLDSGEKAKAYADNYIKVHMMESSQGQTYSQVSGKFMQACPAQDTAKMATSECQQMAGLRQTLFMGDTLRGLLLYGYAFATMGTIAGIAAWVATIGAIVFLVLGILGFMHAKKASRVAR